MVEEFKSPSILTKRHRKNFQKSRHPYKSYLNASWKWIDVLQKIESMRSNQDSNVMERISQEYGIRKGTLYQRYKEWYEMGKPISYRSYDNRGGLNKIFTEDEERDLAIYIKLSFIDKKLPFDNEDLKLLAIERWIKIHPLEPDAFKASKGWIVDFKKKWKFNSVRPRKSHNGPITESIKQEEKEYLDLALREFLRVGSDFFSIWMKHFGK